MRFAYMLYPRTVVSNRSNGVRIQAETWAKQLKRLGHRVDMVSPWEDYDWKCYDAVHYFRGFLRKVSFNHLYPPGDIEKALPYIHKISVRSQCEKDALQKCFKLGDERFEIIPLSYSDACKAFEPVGKESFCLHISSIYQPRKNVIRLIQAAKKYGFNLVLAGYVRDTYAPEIIASKLLESYQY